MDLLIFHSIVLFHFTPFLQANLKFIIMLKTNVLQNAIRILLLGYKQTGIPQCGRVQYLLEYKMQNFLPEKGTGSMVACYERGMGVTRFDVLV